MVFFPNPNIIIIRILCIGTRDVTIYDYAASRVILKCITLLFYFILYVYNINYYKIYYERCTIAINQIVEKIYKIIYYVKNTSSLYTRVEISKVIISRFYY